MMVLNHWLSQSGICSRRKAAELIKQGEVTVNGFVATDPSYRVKPSDVINVGSRSTKQENKVYILVNKPKDYVTTVSDESGRRTVMDLIQGATQYRVYPVGRLDRNTTGLLLLTNDGELTNKLSHPRHEVAKIYDVTLDAILTERDCQKIRDGIILEDGEIVVDAISFIPGVKKNTVMVEIHSGKNRIVRRIFEYFGYEVLKLDRVLYAGLTKKDLVVGKWRYLTFKEITALKSL